MALEQAERDAIRRVTEEVGLEGLLTFGELRVAGVPNEEAERILNHNSWAGRFPADAELEAFHDSIEGRCAPEFHYLVLILVDMGHTITEAVHEIRNNRPLVLRLIGRHNYLKKYMEVRRWLDWDRLSDEAKKMKSETYHREGPEGELATLILDRIRDRETAQAKRDMEERNEAIRANGATD